MRGFSPELDINRRTAQRRRGHQTLSADGMHAERGVYVLEEALADKAALGAAVFAAFFAGRAVNADFAADGIDDLLERRGGKRGHSTEQVVSAAVSQPLKRIIFG